ncbi:hypothetical protein Goshw_007740 [Gossypium schwendimanii]|uniref:Starch synthase catalytic domain-containing protein n=1 Tax=Gossypium schwendimanii TaxID=34291 RepID=A0A7J9L228_GOSSC|nr:hypothetical protein [Gossypium schwendimanii]
MATLTTSHFVSTSSHFSSHGADTKANLAQVGARNQAMTHNGLRSLNKVDRLQMRTTNAKAVVTKAMKQADHRPLGKIICGIGMNIVFVSAECGPWSKTGGLGDVLGGLPPAMAAKGHRVMTVCPRYDQYKDAWDTSVLVDLKVGDKVVTVRFFHCYKRGVDRVFVDHPMFLEKVWGKTASKIYGPRAGLDYEDNQLRFSLLCQAALEAPRVLNLNSSKNFSGPYGEDVVFIANDWHSALLPCYLKSMYQSRGIYMNAKVFIVRYNKPVKGRKINWMKAGILESHRVLTVSPYYAQELVSGEDKGVELDNIIRKTGITGIVNGMDVQEWNPASDKYISVKYDATTGTGKKAMEKQIEQLEIQYPDNVRAVAKFNVPLAHMIIAGADYILVPSRFEPCGLIQLHAMRYGTVPIVASTGGLVDTVKEGFTGFQMGAFNVECDEVDPSDVIKVVKTVKRALATYGTQALKEMIQNCMAQDFSWKGPSRLWEKMLLSLGVAGNEPGIEGEEVAPLAKENVATP